jgi:hypothetical protein
MRLANFDDLVSPLPWAFLHNQDPKRTFGFSFDHLVGEDEEWGRDSEAERFGGLGIEQQAHRVLRPVGHSLLMYGSNYFCFVVSPFM